VRDVDVCYDALHSGKHANQGGDGRIA